MFNMTF